MHQKIHQNYVDEQIKNIINSVSEEHPQAEFFYIDPEVGETAADMYNALHEQIKDLDDPATKYILRQLERYVGNEKRFGSNKKQDFIAALDKWRERYYTYLSNPSPVIIDEGFIKCPLCDCQQQARRTMCYQCGITFEQGE